MSDDLVEYLKAPVVLGEKAVGPGELVEQMLSKMSEAANRIEADSNLIQEMREALEDGVGLLEVIKEDWIDYDHIYSIHVHETKLLISKAKSQQERRDRMSWQPIGTAPMDGTEVITAKKSDMVKAFDHFAYPIKSKFIDGSCVAEFSDGEWHKYDPQPSHWLPISPPLPISKAHLT